MRAARTGAFLDITFSPTTLEALAGLEMAFEVAVAASPWPSSPAARATSAPQRSISSCCRQTFAALWAPVHLGRAESLARWLDGLRERG
jgi:hypothetical protein